MLVDEHTILASLETDTLIPFCQPLRELRTGRLMGFELLARWDHPDHGPVLPPTFISVAEDANLLTRLTSQLLAKAFRALHSLPASLTLAVNISPMQLRDPAIATSIREVAARHRFPLDRLVIEITETAVVDNLLLAQEIIGRLKHMGCRILLDDFGVGYSSLAHLQTLHFDGLKIDRSFVSGILHRREDRKIVAAIIGLGQNLGITTIAEGIETEEQANMLLYLGCEAGQGYLYGRPQPLSAVPGFLDAPPPAAIPSIPGAEHTLSSLESLPFERVAQLQAIYDGAPVGLGYLNKDLRYVSVNRRLSEIDGVAILSMLGRSIAAVFPAWFPIYQPYLQRALHGESLRDIEITRPPARENDPETVALVSFEPARDEASEVIGISIAVMDITERKRKEKALIESERRFRTIIDLNPETPWILDTSGNILEVGSQWEKKTGFTREETLRRGYMDTVVEEDRARVWEIIQRSLQAGAPLDFECRARRFDGTSFWIRVRGTPVRDDNGNITLYYGSTDDIDDVKRLSGPARTLPENQNG